MKINGIDFNEDWARNRSKAEFVAQHEHHAEEVDLGEAWESLQEGKDEEDKPKKAKRVTAPASSSETEKVD